MRANGSHWEFNYRLAKWSWGLSGANSIATVVSGLIQGTDLTETGSLILFVFGKLATRDSYADIRVREGQYEVNTAIRLMNS